MILCCGLILIGCNSGDSSTYANPTVSLTTPTPGAINVSLIPNITLTFSAAVTGVNTNTLQLESVNGQPQPITTTQNGNSYTITPIATTNVSLNTNTIILTFSEAVTGVNTNTLQFESKGGLPQPITITQNGNSYTFPPSVALVAGTQYVVLVNSGITSVNTRAPVAPIQFNFTTLPAPTVSLASPNPTTNVSLTPNITLTFSEPVIGVNTSTIQLQTQGGQLQTININPSSGSIYTLVLSGALLPGAQYVVLVNSGITSAATGAKVVPTQFNFTTATGPTVSLTSPTPITNVILNPIITLTFSEAVSGVNTNTLQFESKGGLPQPITLTKNGNSYTVTPSGSLLSGTQYVVLVNFGIISATTGSPVAPIQFNFTTLPAPTVSLTSPIPGTTNVSLTPTITLTFNEAVSGVNTTTLQLQTQGGLPQTFTLSNSGNSYTLIPSAPLLLATQYAVIVNSGISSTATGLLVAPYQANFTTTLQGPFTLIGTIATGSAPRGIIISQDGANVYVIDQISNTVSQYSRSESGRLTSIGTVVTGPTPIGINITPDGKNVYVSNYNGNTVSQYSRDPSTGLLTALTPESVPTGRNPAGVGISPTGNNVYVFNEVSNTISQYSRNTITGVLTALTPATVATGTTPTRITISADGLNVYVTNSGSNTISQYSRNQATGLLTALPPTIATGLFPQGIRVSIDGKNVYVTNQNSNTLSQYSRNQATGQLTALIPATLATESRPNQIITSPDDNFVYVSNGNSNTVSQYSRNISTGLLTTYGTPIATGNNPSGITISPDGVNAYISDFGDDNISQYSR